MDDRELLEKAAKAAGSVLKHGSEFSPQVADLDYIKTDDGWGVWMPLHDDGDALRLAVRLRLNVMQGEYSCGASDEREVDVVEVFVGTDPYAATRRAIVRAAAAIGEKPYD